MQEVTVILHGWSDCSLSFVRLKAFLITNGIGNVATIHYADYESREDNISFNDIADGLFDQFIVKGFIQPNGKKLCHLNVIVHSTGGLVIRHWIARYYYERGIIDDCPIKRLIMLAPANFGSPLAHRGKSFLGTLIAGRWKIGDMLEVGRQLLDGLELASPFQWNLAHRDLLISKPFYNSRQIQTTILVGIEDYKGVKGWINKPGTDGTVVIAGTSLNSAKLILDFSGINYERRGTEPSFWAYQNPPEEFAFGILPGLNHGSIVGSISSAQAGSVGRLLLEALKTTNEQDFLVFRDKLFELTEQTYAQTGKPQYQQLLLHAIDDQGMSVRDFTVEFFIYKSSRKRSECLITGAEGSLREMDFSAKIHALITNDVHTNANDPSYRRFLVNVDAVGSLLAQAAKTLKSDVVLSMKIFIPDIDNKIRYQTLDLQNIVLIDTANNPNQRLSFLYNNTTTLVELRVNRYNTYVTVGTEPRKH